MSNSEMQSAAAAFFNANFNISNSTTPVITASYSPSGPTVDRQRVDDREDRLPADHRPGRRSDQRVVDGGVGRRSFRVALVLDNTGSMKDDGKMTALKTASKNLLDKLKAAAIQNGDVYVSIVPFSKDVNVGPSNSAASWMRWDLWDEVNGSCAKNNGKSNKKTKKYVTKSSCESANYTWTPDDHATWNGCVTDRDQNYDVSNDAPTSTSREFPAEQYDSCPAQLMDLSYDWNALNSKINAMQPNGNTNQAIGLQWGWQSLTKSPFTIPAYDPRYQYKLIIILLTDGMNTERPLVHQFGTISMAAKRRCATTSRRPASRSSPSR